MPFKKGDPNINRKGRIDGGFSITSLVKAKLQECPEGTDKTTYADKFIESVFKKAIDEGDVQMLKSVWAYMDGLPKETKDVNLEFGGKSEDEIKDEMIKIITDNLKHKE